MVFGFSRKKEEVSVSYTDITTKKYLADTRIRKLQLGCGENMYEGWLNSDLNEGDNRISLDITKPFPFKNKVFHYVYSEHTIEHLTYGEGQFMLAECLRVMKSGGIIRTVTPKLEFLVDLFNNPDKPLNKRYITWAVKNFAPYAGTNKPGFVINNFVRAWGHQFIYDEMTLRHALKVAGFVQINKVMPGESKYDIFHGLESHANDLGQDFYNLESMVLEAKKP